MALDFLDACRQQFQMHCQASSFRAVSHQCDPGAQRTGSQNPEMTKRFSLARAQRIYHNLGFQEPRVTSKSACAAQPEHRVEPLAGGTGPDLGIKRFSLARAQRIEKSQTLSPMRCSLARAHRILGPGSVKALLPGQGAPHLRARTCDKALLPGQGAAHLRARTSDKALLPGQGAAHLRASICDKALLPGQGAAHLRARIYDKALLPVQGAAHLRAWLCDKALLPGRGVAHLRDSYHAQASRIR